MEEEKAAAYYDELTRKGEGAARFKQGLGFSSIPYGDQSTDIPSRISRLAIPSRTSVYSSFVRASSPSNDSEFERRRQLEHIQNKLKKKTISESDYSRVRISDSNSHRRSRSIERNRTVQSNRSNRIRNRSQSRESFRGRDKDQIDNGDRKRRKERRVRRSRSRSASSEDERGANRSRTRRSISPSDGRCGERIAHVGKERNVKPDYSSLIKGYDEMSAAERVRAKMKLQLSETAKKDRMIGCGPGWERFEFNKDAPLEDEEVEAAEDDAKLAQQVGQSFRFSAVQARRENDIRTAHEDAIFGTSKFRSSDSADSVDGNTGCDATASLISDKVLAKQHGSWRDHARKM